MEKEYGVYTSDVLCNGVEEKIFNSLIDIYNFKSMLIGEESNYIEIFSGDCYIDLPNSILHFDKIKEIVIEDDNILHLYVDKEIQAIEVPILKNQLENAKLLVDFINKFIKAKKETQEIIEKENLKWIKENVKYKLRFKTKEIYDYFGRYRVYSRYTDDEIIYYSKLKVKNKKLYWNFKDIFEIEITDPKSQELIKQDVSKLKAAEIRIYETRCKRNDPIPVYFELTLEKKYKV